MLSEKKFDYLADILYVVTPEMVATMYKTTHRNVLLWLDTEKIYGYQWKENGAWLVSLRSCIDALGYPKITDPLPLPLEGELHS